MKSQDHEGAAPGRRAQHDRPRAARPCRPWSRTGSSRSSATSASRSARTSRSCVPDAVLAVQETQEGTGHAVRVALEALPARRPAPSSWPPATPRCCEGETLRAFADEHEAAQRAVSILSRRRGRTRSATAGSCATPRATSRRSSRRRTRRPSSARSPRSTPGSSPSTRSSCSSALPRIANDNAKGEYYLTDAVQLARDDGLTVGAHLDRRRRADRGRQRPRPARRARPGAQPPHRHPLDAGRRDGHGPRHHLDRRRRGASSPTSTILPGTQLLGATVIGEDAVIGPDTTLKDCEVGAGARVVRTHGELAVIGDRATVGPFSYLRPGTRLGVARQDRRLRRDQERRRSATAPRSRTCPTSATPRSARAPTSAPARSSPTTTASPKHRTTIGAPREDRLQQHLRRPGRRSATARAPRGGTVVRRDVPPGALAVSSGPAAQPRGLDRVAARRHRAGRGGAGGA